MAQKAAFAAAVFHLSNQKSGTSEAVFGQKMHEDHQFIEALRTGDAARSREIYRRFAPEALRWGLNNHATADDARDFFQEAVMAIFEKAQRPDFLLTCPLGALLYLIYSRKWIDKLREKKRDSRVRILEEARYKSDSPDDAPIFLAEEIEAEAQKSRQLAAAFSQLSDLCQRLLKLLADGTAPKTAAENLEMNSVETLYRRKNACASRWRELVG